MSEETAKIEFSVMDGTGDTKTIFDSTQPAEVDTAREQFEKLVNDEGYKAFKVKKNGDKGKRMKEFDAKSGKIIFVPRMVGG